MMTMLQIVVLFLVIISQPGLCLENKSEYHDLASLLEYPASVDDLEHIRSVLKHVSILYPEQRIRLNTTPIDADSINIIYFSFTSHRVMRRQIKLKLIETTACINMK